MLMKKNSKSNLITQLNLSSEKCKCYDLQKIAYLSLKKTATSFREQYHQNTIPILTQQMHKNTNEFHHFEPQSLTAVQNCAKCLSTLFVLHS